MSSALNDKESGLCREAASLCDDLRVCWLNRSDDISGSHNNHCCHSPNFQHRLDDSSCSYIPCGFPHHNRDDHGGSLGPYNSSSPSTHAISCNCERGMRRHIYYGNVRKCERNGSDRLSVWQVRACQLAPSCWRSAPSAERRTRSLRQHPTLQVQLLKTTMLRSPFASNISLQIMCLIFSMRSRNQAFPSRE